MTIRKPAKATLPAEAEGLRADYADACRELRLCREALRRVRLALWGIRPLDEPPTA